MGRIVRVDKESCQVFVEGKPEEVPEEIMVKTDAVNWKGKEPAVGDFVELEISSPDSQSEISLKQILPRKTVLFRKDPGGFAQEQVIASNMDIVALVQGLDQKLNIPKLERGLVLAAESGAEAQIILSKADLVDEPYLKSCVDEISETELLEKPILVTSSITHKGIPALNDLISDGLTLVLLGSSGAGKSSLVNALIQNITQKTAEVRSTDARGRHATVARSLIALPGGGFVIDTPGLRAIGLGEIDVGIDEVFADVSTLAENCKFRDCAHLEEPDCAVKSAVAAGDLSAKRLERYLRLKEEADQSAKESEEMKRRRRR